MHGSARRCWIGSPIQLTFWRPERNRIASGGRSAKERKERNGRRRNELWKCRPAGKPRKPKAGFPLFPPSLESPQKQRASHIPTAPTTAPYLTKTKHGRPYGRAENRHSEGGPEQTAV